MEVSYGLPTLTPQACPRPETLSHGLERFRAGCILHSTASMTFTEGREKKILVTLALNTCYISQGP